MNHRPTTRQPSSERRQTGRGRLDHLIRRLRKAPGADVIPRLPDDGPPARLSPGQERLWFLERLEPGRATYNLPLVLELRGALDVTVLLAALARLVRRHEILRTRYAVDSEGPWQCVEEHPPRFMTVADLEGLGDRGAAAADRLEARMAARPFDLERGPVLRVVSTRLAADRHRLLLVVHHIAIDGASQRILVEELLTFYDALAVGDRSVPQLADPPLRYADFAAWQRRRLPEILAAHLAAWRDNLAGVPALELPLDRPRPARRAGRGGVVSRRLLADRPFVALRKLGEARGATAFMTLLAALETLLARYSGQGDFAVGTPIAGRTRAELERAVGFFVQTLVLRADTGGDPSFEELLERVRRRTLAAYEHQEVPFERLVEELEPSGRQGAVTPLFQVMMSFVEGGGPPRSRSPHLEVEWSQRHTGTAKFDLWLELTHEAPGPSQDAAAWGEGLRAVLEYDCQIFDRTTAHRLLEALSVLLESLASASPDAVAARPLSGWPILPAVGLHQVLAEWNDTARLYAPAVLYRAFEERAVAAPGAVALAFDGATSSYGEMASAVHRLARHLIASGVGMEDRVGVMMDRSFELVVALYAVLEAGAAYVPLDPSYPGERLAEMLEDSRRGAAAPVVLAQEAHAGRLREIAVVAGLEILAIEVDGADRAAIAARSSRPPRREPSLDQAAYVIFTSGSTGRPKGVVNSHRGIANRLIWMQEAFELSAEDRVLQKTPMSFDVSVWEFFWPLSVGARLVLARPDGHKDPAYLARTIREQGVTTLHFVPSMLRVFVEALGSQQDQAGLDSLRRVICSGEALPIDLVERFEERLGMTGVELHNLYGPTEAAVDVTWWPCAGWRASRRVPIGRPIANTRIHVVDRRLRPVPIGVAGELLLGGVQLARGYLSRPGLTAESFVPGLDRGIGTRLYRTGDLTRYLSDGNVEYLGRIDFQVKLRGFRIELGEIEAALGEIGGVREAVVVVREKDGDPRLVAYVVGAEELDDPRLALVRATLAARLPEHMVPAKIMRLAAMPLSPNGKLDRRRLPEPEWESASSAHAAPRTHFEVELAAIWHDLLGVSRIGVGDDFFALGGHSLLATRLVARLRQRFGVEVELRRIFERPTLEGMAEEVAAARIASDPPLERLPHQPGEPLPLSPAQRRLWFLERLDPGRTTYNIPLLVELRGELDAAALRRALLALAERHEILRTRFVLSDGEPAQIVEAAARSFITLVDLRRAVARTGEVAETGEATRLLARETRRSFDLERGPLLRAVVLRDGAAHGQLLLHLHHIVSDGWSHGVMLDEVAAFYEGFASGREPALATLAVQYADYARWQRERRAEVLDEQLAWWRQRLAGVPVLELPTDRPRPAARTGHGGRIHRPLLSAAGLATLEELGRRCGATVFMLLLAAFEALLARLSGQKDFAVGTPIAGRTRPELEASIGFFVNTLALRSDLGEPRLSFAALVERIRGTVLGAFEHAEISFERLVEELYSGPRGSTPPLCQVALAPQLNVLEKRRAAGLDMVPRELPDGTAKLDLTLGFKASADGLWAGIEYDRQLFERISAQRVLGHLSALLEAAIADPQRELVALPLSSPGERHQMLFEWNDTAAGILGGDPDRLPVHRLVLRHADRRPRALAVAGEGGSLDYGTLADRARRLAGRLERRGVGPETRVGVFLEPSLELVSTLLGVLESGGAYVPFDPAVPAERLAFQLADAGASVLVTSAELRLRLEDVAVTAEILTLEDSATEDTAPGSPAPCCPAPCCPAPVRLDHLAYVIYTSGSTGRPKGALLTHRGLLNLVKWKGAFFGLGPDDRCSQVASPSFDAMVWELWPALAAGASVHIPPAEIARVPSRLASWLTDHRITESWQPTPLGEALIDELARTGVPPGWSLRTLNLAGDRLHAAPPPGLPFIVINAYGPTEATAASSCSLVRPAPGDSRAPSIGRPIFNTAHLVVDRQLRPVVLGARGELAISGPGLGRGYHRRPALTAERFVPDEASAEPGARLYLSGDLVRHRADGELDFLGRVDHQVKVRGFRIELGEVEALMRQDERVGEILVMPQRREDDPAAIRLVAWITLRPAADEEGEEALNQLRAALGRRLPEYMIPAVFVPLDDMPVLPSGKIDRAAVMRDAAPDWTGSGEYVAPRNLLETELAEIWRELLGVERPGVTDDFFLLGGHSLLATRLVARLVQHFGVELELRRVFDSPTIAELAQHLEAASGRTASVPPPLVPEPLVATGERCPAPLSFAQERLWILDQLDPGQAGYNVSTATELSGVLRHGALAAALGEIVRRHESLRTTFTLSAGRPVQKVGSPPLGALPLIDLAGLGTASANAELDRRVLADAQTPFDLERGPLLRTALLRLAQRRHVLLINMHHIVSDGWSLGVFQRELAALYRAALTGTPSPLGDLPVQYADFAIWQRRFLSGAELERQLAWWRERLAGVPDLELPFDRPRGGRLSLRGAFCESRLPASLTAELEELARQAGATLFMVLLAAWNVLLARLSGQCDFAVGTPIANRNRAEIEPLIGFFVNTLVLRAGFAAAAGRKPSFSDLLERVRQTTLDAYAHQDIPFQKLVEDLAERRQLDVTPFFQVMFALQTATPEGTFSGLPGLTAEPRARDAGVSKFDLGVQYTATPRGLEGHWAFKTGLFDRVTVARLVRSFAHLLAAAVEAPYQPFSEIPLLGEVELHQTLIEWNDQPDYPAAELLHAPFRTQSRRAPERTAFLIGDDYWSYGELARRAGRLARVLREHGVGPEVLVGVCLERSMDLMVALFAILEAGGAYVPLSPEDPSRRLEQIYEASGVGLVLTRTSLLASLPDRAGGVSLLCLDRPEDLELTADPRPAADLRPAADPRPAAEPHPDNVAYVLFTSGSTGRPKGVMVSHRAIAGRLAFMAAEELHRNAVFIQKTTLTFDPSLAEIFAPLFVGGRSVAARPGLAREAGHLLELVRRHGVTHTTLARALLEILLDGGELASCASLRQVLVGGEKMPEDLPDAFYAQRPETRLENRYGPTEAAISVTRWICRPGAPERPLPIGRPIARAEIFLLDRWGQPAPVGAMGEIAIGGPVLARGYLGRPGRTAQSFIPHPRAAGERLYRSGDLGRARHDGAIEFHGRIDTQVKIRGFRVELGEIESTLRHHAVVRDAAVIDLPDGDTRRLAAFVVPRRRAEADDGAALRAFLEGRLPEYMVPPVIYFLDGLPTTSAGKIDRAALAGLAPQERPATGRLAPRDAVEELLVERWRELLGVSQVGVEDDFFTLGGSSISAALLTHRLQEDLGLAVPVSALFEAPTIAGLARYLSGRGAVVPAAGNTPAVEDDRVTPRPPGTLRAPLTASQLWYWRLDRLRPGHPAYNLPLSLELAGKLEVAALCGALESIVGRHEALRTTFELQDGEPVQRVDPTARLAFTRLDLGALPAAIRAVRARRLGEGIVAWRFDLARGPLLRVFLLRLTDTEHRLFLMMHHIVADGWSVGVLERELAVLYAAALQGPSTPAPALPPLPLQVPDFGFFEQRRRAARGELRDWWRQHLDEAPRTLELPFDRPRPPRRSLRGGVIRRELGPELSWALAELARARRSTLFMVLLTGFEVLLHELTGRTDLLVGTQVANRDRAETRDLVGYFVNLLALRADLSGDPTFEELLERTRRETAAAFAYQEWPIGDLIDDLGEPLDGPRPALFQVLFTLQNARRGTRPGAGPSLPGLRLGVLEPPSATARFDLSLAMVEGPDTIGAEMEYAADLFEPATVAGWLERLEALLGDLAARPAARLSHLVERHDSERLEAMTGPKTPGR